MITQLLQRLHGKVYYMGLKQQKTHLFKAIQVIVYSLYTYAHLSIIPELRYVVYWEEYYVLTCLKFIFEDN